VLDLVAFAFGRVEIEDAQAEVGRQGDVLGLADVETLRR
jgi:hypothetical protein